VDEQGQVLVSGRDLGQLRRRLQAQTTAAFASSRHAEWQREGLRVWDFGELPEEIRWQRRGLVVTGYPTLVDQGQDVALRLVDCPATAAWQTRGGVRRLCCLAEREELRAQVAWLPNLERLELLAANLCNADSLERQVAELIADRAFLETDALPRNAEAFRRFLDRGRERIGLAVQDVTQLILPLLETHHQACLAWEGLRDRRWPYAVEDLRTQRQQLTAPGFLANTPWTWLRHYPRYFRAMTLRVDKLTHGAQPRDQQNTVVVAAFWQAYQQRAEEHRTQGLYDPELVQFRWMLEEFRVSLFAQELGTSLAVSEKRLEKQWARVR
jgi:ATP-dependent helicase HrpA